MDAQRLGDARRRVGQQKGPKNVGKWKALKRSWRAREKGDFLLPLVILYVIQRRLDLQ